MDERHPDAPPAPPDDILPVGRPHRAGRDLDMLVLDYERGVETVTLPAGAVFQPWRPLDHWRGVKVPITLGDAATEFNWGVTSPDGHFLRWDDFFAQCEPVETGAPPPGVGRDHLRVMGGVARSGRPPRHDIGCQLLASCACDVRER